jgi:hypothetical protein
VIPALLAAAPIVEGVLGGVMSTFAPQSSTPPPFSPALNQAQATSAPAPAPAPVIGPQGTFTQNDWSQMTDSSRVSWAKSLTGAHVFASDSTGRTYSGVVGGVEANNGVIALNIGGHLVNLSQLKQVSWSPNIV